MLSPPHKARRRTSPISRRHTPNGSSKNNYIKVHATTKHTKSHCSASITMSIGTSPILGGELREVHPDLSRQVDFTMWSC